MAYQEIYKGGAVMISFEQIREEIIRKEEQEEFAEIAFDIVAAQIDAYENKHLADVTDPNEPSYPELEEL